MRLKDKVAVVTGASQGLGLACAERFAAEGAKVMLCDLKEEAGRAAAARLGGRFVRADVGSKADVDALMAATLEACGRIDVLVSNAGIVTNTDFLEVTEEEFDRVLRVNLKGVFLCGQAAARQMVKQGQGGAIVNMSSIGAELVNPRITPYVVAKGGVRQLTAAMALALAPHAIRVNAIGPGTILTDLAREAVLSNDTARRQVLSRTPLGRMGDPSEVAAVALFLASEESSYITGQTIYPDGGRLVLNYTVPVPD